MSFNRKKKNNKRRKISFEKRINNLLGIKQKIREGNVVKFRQKAQINNNNDICLMV